MAQQAHFARKSNTATLPRGVVIAALALLSWGLVLAAWRGIAASFALLLGA